MCLTATFFLPAEDTVELFLTGARSFFMLLVVICRELAGTSSFFLGLGLGLLLGTLVCLSERLGLLTLRAASRASTAAMLLVVICVDLVRVETASFCRFSFAMFVFEVPARAAGLGTRLGPATDVTLTPPVVQVTRGFSEWLLLVVTMIAEGRDR